MAGERDARKGYKPWLPMAGGFLVGAGAVIAMLVKMKLMRHTVGMQSGGVELRMLHGNHFVLHRVPEKDGRQAGLHLQLAGGLAEEFFSR